MAEARAGRPAPAVANVDVTDGFVAVGVVLTAFGLNGDLKVEPLTDFPERFSPGASLWLGGAARRVERSRWQRGIVFLKLSGIDAPEQVAALRGRYLELPAADRAPLPEGAFYQSDLIGLAVVTQGGEDLGHVLEFLPTGANDVLVVRGARGDVLIPMIEDVIVAINLAAGAIVVHNVDELLPDRAPGPRPRRGMPRWRRRRVAGGGTNATVT